MIIVKVNFSKYRQYCGCQMLVEASYGQGRRLFLCCLVLDGEEDALEEVGIKFLAENIFVLVQQIDLRRGDNVIHFMPIYIGLAAVQIEPTRVCEVVALDKLVP